MLRAHPAALRALGVSTALIGAIVSLVGPSRVYLGHHWLTDVLGSYSLGTGYLATLIGLHRRGLKDEKT